MGFLSAPVLAKQTSDRQVGKDAFRPGYELPVARVTSHVERLFCFAFAFVVLVFLYSAAGEYAGDIWHLVLVLLICTLGVGCMIAARFGAIGRAAELELLLMLGSVFIVVVPSYCFMSPYTTDMDLFFVIVTLPMCVCVRQLCRVYMAIEEGTEARNNVHIPVCLGVVMVSASLRCSYDETSFWALGIMGPLSASLVAIANIIVYMGKLTSEARAALKRQNSELHYMRSFVGRILMEHCDAVLELNDDLCLQQPSRQVQQWLAPDDDDLGQLQGRCLKEFLASSKDIERLQDIISTSERKIDLAGSCKRPVSGVDIDICMKNAKGELLRPTIFHYTMDDKLVGDRPIHILGLLFEREMRLSKSAAARQSRASRSQEERSQNSHTEANGSDSSECKDSEQSTTSDDCQEGDVQESNEDDGTEIETPGGLVSTSRIALRFDADTPAFDLLAHNPLLTSLRPRSERHRLLDWASVDQEQGFEEWVVRQMQAAPWDQAVTSSLFPGPLTLELPKVKRRTIHAQRAWLCIDVPKNGLAATLWLQGIRQGRPALSPVKEEDHLSSDGSCACHDGHRNLPAESLESLSVLRP